MSNYVQQIINAMYTNEKLVKNLTNQFDIPLDPDTAAEYLTMLPEKDLKKIIKQI